MCAERAAASRVARRLARAAVAIAGVAGIVASGGGNLACFDACNGNGPPPPPFASVHPGRITVQVGASVVFSSRVANATQPTYRWCRQPAGSSACVDIPGATGDSLTVAGANLADDGALYTLHVSAANGTSDASGLLGVSSQPPIVFQDTEFAASDWAASAVATPAVGGPTHVESTSATGGNPGAFRSMTYEMPQAPSSIRVFHVALNARVDPATQGAIRSIDFSADCLRSTDSTSGDVPYIAPLLEQGGRTFVATAQIAYCASARWDALEPRYGIGPDEFVLVDGPACAASETCPDFSAGAAPLRFGVASGSDLQASSTTGTIVQGIDNWLVKVWPR